MVDVAQVHRLLQALEGRQLSFSVFARDTPVGRSSGAATECHLYRARASVVSLPSPAGQEGQATGQQTRDRPPRQLAMLVELVGDRFLRRMVRTLVSTSVREAAIGAGDEGLLALMETGDRRATAPPAPPQGLCLAGVGYGDAIPPAL